MCPGQTTLVQSESDDRDELVKAGYEYVEGTPVPQPMARPQFTLADLRNAIPPHCFERSMVKSFGYLALDVVIISSLLCFTYALFEMLSLPLYCQLIGYPIYWFVQGSVMFGIWVLAHECGECSLRIHAQKCCNSQTNKKSTNWKNEIY